MCRGWLLAVLLVGGFCRSAAGAERAAVVLEEVRGPCPGAVFEAALARAGVSTDSAAGVKMIVHERELRLLTVRREAVLVRTLDTSDCLTLAEGFAVIVAARFAELAPQFAFAAPAPAPSAPSAEPSASPVATRRIPWRFSLSAAVGPEVSAPQPAVRGVGIMAATLRQGPAKFGVLGAVGRPGRVGATVEVERTVHRALAAAGMSLKYQALRLEPAATFGAAFVSVYSPSVEQAQRQRATIPEVGLRLDAFLPADRWALWLGTGLSLPLRRELYQVDGRQEEVGRGPLLSALVSLGFEYEIVAR